MGSLMSIAYSGLGLVNYGSEFMRFCMKIIKFIYKGSNNLLYKIFCVNHLKTLAKLFKTLQST